MVNKIVYYIFFIYAIISYNIVTKTYSESFCQQQFYMYLMVCLFAIYENYKRFQSVFNANTIFLIIFGLTTYLHSAFFMPIENFFSAYSRYSYNLFAVNRGIVIAQIGISSYLLGTTFYKHEKMKHEKMKTKFSFALNYTSVYQKFSLAISLLWFLYIFIFFKRDSAYVIIYPKLTLLLTSVFIINFILSIFKFKASGSYKIKDFILENKLNWFSLILFLLPFFYLGSRTIPSALVLVFLSLINKYIYKIRLSFIFLFLVVGTILMGFVSISRISDVNFLNSDIVNTIKSAQASIIENGNILAFFLQDFIVNARNLYDGVNYPASNNLIFGVGYFASIFSFVPFLPTILLDLMGLSPLDVDTSTILTKLNNASFGLGTHIIGDLYMNGKLFFVVVVMFALGYLITKSEYHKSIINLLLSCSFYSVVLMLARVSPFAWLDLFYMLLIQYVIITKLKLR